jgi:hypothetical protein
MISNYNPGNYYFCWTAVAACGTIEGKFEQTIYGETLTAAVEQFQFYHGAIGPNEDGVCLVINSIAWQP